MIYSGYGGIQQEKYYSRILEFSVGGFPDLLHLAAFHPLQGPAGNIPGAAYRPECHDTHHLTDFFGSFGLFHQKVFSEAYQGGDILFPAFPAYHKF